MGFLPFPTHSNLLFILPVHTLSVISFHFYSKLYLTIIFQRFFTYGYTI